MWRMARLASRNCNWCKNMRSFFQKYSHDIAWSLLVAVPIILPFVRRAAPIILIVAAGFTLLPFVLQQQLTPFLKCLRTKSFYALSAFLACAALTLAWAPLPTRGLHAVASLALVFLSGHILLQGLEPPSQKILRQLTWGVAFGASVIAIDLLTGGHLLKLVHAQPEPYRYNMVLISLLVISVAMLQVGTWGKLHIGALACLPLIAAIAVGSSETAKIAGLFGFSSLFLARFVALRMSLFVSIIAVLAAWYVSLLMPDAAQRLAGFFWTSLREDGHVFERINIWMSFSKMALAGLPWGWGVESVSAVPATSYFFTAPESMKPWLEFMHPHNNYIQIATEMGLVGIGFAGFLSFMMVMWVHSNEKLRSVRTGFLVIFLIVALVSHGFWQAWWWSAVLIGMRFCEASQSQEAKSVKA